MERDDYRTQQLARIAGARNTLTPYWYTPGHSKDYSVDDDVPLDAVWGSVCEIHHETRSLKGECFSCL